MDITRNWRLKSTRSTLLASRDPQTGELVLPQNAGVAPRRDYGVYTFEREAPRQAEMPQAAR